MAQTVFVGQPGAAGADGATWYAASGTPGGGTGAVNDLYINTATGNYYKKTGSSTWTLQASLVGPGYLASSTTSLALASSGSKTFTTQAGLAFSAGCRIRAYNDATHYMEGVVTSYSGTSLVATMDRAVGSGTLTAWAISLAGDVGATGATGSPGVAYTPLGAYAGGTTYAQGDEVTDSSILYISLQASNTGHTPASSPTWWQPVATPATAQTPWAADIAGAGFSLSGLGYIAFPQLSYTASSGLNSNINITTHTFVRVGAGSGAYTLGGFTGGVDGRVLIVHNPFSVTMTIKNEDASSTAANRIATLTGADVNLASGRQSNAGFIYDSALSRWLVLFTY